MKKDDVFKAGAESVAKPMEKKVNEWADNINRQTEQQISDFEEFADAVIENEERKENDISNITLLPSFNQIEEDRDVAIILNVINKYYLHPQYLKNADSEEVIKTINYYTRKLSLTESTYNVDSMSTLEDKEKGSLLLYGILCLLNEITDAFPEELFAEIKGELYLPNSKMKEIELQIHNIASTYYISSILELIFEDITEPEETEEEEHDEEIQETIEQTEDEPVINLGIYAEEFTDLKAFICSYLKKFGDKAIINEDLNDDLIKNCILSDIDKRIAIESVIGVLHYSYNIRLLFTTYGIYYLDSLDSNTEIPYKKLLNIGSDSIEENIAIGEDDFTTFKVNVQDNFHMDFRDAGFDNKLLLEFFLRLFENVNLDMVSETDKYILMANMEEETKIKYLITLLALFENKSIYTAEVYRLANELKCFNAFIMKSGNLQDRNLYDLFEDLKNSIHYPSFKVVGYSLYKDYLKILYQCSIDNKEYFRIKRSDAENIDKVTDYFKIDDIEKTYFKNIIMFLTQMHIDVTVSEYEEFQNNVKKLKSHMLKQQVECVFKGEGEYWVLHQPKLEDALVFHKTKTTINLLQQQIVAIKSHIMSYTKIMTEFGKINSDYYDKQLYYNIIEYYKRMIDVFNDNVSRINENIVINEEKIETNKATETLKKMSGFFNDNIDKLKESETTNEVFKKVGGLFKKKK